MQLSPVALKYILSTVSSHRISVVRVRRRGFDAEKSKTTDAPGDDGETTAPDVLTRRRAWQWKLVFTKHTVIPSPFVPYKVSACKSRDRLVGPVYALNRRPPFSVKTAFKYGRSPRAVPLAYYYIICFAPLFMLSTIILYYTVCNFLHRKLKSALIVWSYQLKKSKKK